MVPAKETLLTAVQATNFTNYMYEVGMDGFTRKIACSLYPTATNELVDKRTKRTRRAPRAPSASSAPAHQAPPRALP